MKSHGAITAAILYSTVLGAAVSGCGSRGVPPTSLDRQAPRTGDNASQSDAFERGLDLFARGEYYGAVQWFNAAADTEPDNPDIFFQRGRAFHCLGDLRRSIRDYTHTINLDPEHTDAYYWRARVFIASGNFFLFRQAELNLTWALELNPTCFNAYQSRGVVRHLMGDHENSIADHTEALALAPDLVIGYVGRAVSARAIGDIEQALSDYNEALRLQPRLGLAYGERGSLHAAKGEWDKALADFRRQIEFTEAGPFEFCLVAETLCVLDRPEEAIAKFSRAIELDQTYVPAYLGRSNAYRALGQMDNADADTDKARSLDPDLEL